MVRLAPPITPPLGSVTVTVSPPVPPDCASEAGLRKQAPAKTRMAKRNWLGFILSPGVWAELDCVNLDVQSSHRGAMAQGTQSRSCARANQKRCRCLGE